MDYGNNKGLKKNYAKVLRHQINDFTLEPPDIEEKDFITTLSKEPIFRTSISPTLHLLLAKPSRRLNPPSAGRFEQIFCSPDLLSIGMRVLAFLPFKSQVFVMRTCKSIFAVLDEKIWKFRIESMLRTDIDRLALSMNRVSLQHFCQSLHTNLLPFKVFSTDKMFASNNIEIRFLAGSLVDFQKIKSLSSKQILQRFVWSDMASTLMLSLDKIGKVVTIWTIGARSEHIAPFVIQKYPFEEAQEIVSARFHTEDFIIVQIKDAETKKLQVVIIDVRKEFVALRDLTFLKSIHQKAIFRKIENEGTQENGQERRVQIQEEREVYVDGELPSNFLVTSLQKDKLLLYSKGSSMVFLYCLVSSKLEVVYNGQMKEELLSVIVPERQPASPEKLTIFLLFKDRQIKVVELDQTGTNIAQKDLFYFSKSPNPPPSEDKPCIFKYRLGQYLSSKGTLIEYLMVLKDNVFYYIDLLSQKARKLVILMPSVKGVTKYNECQSWIGGIRGRNLTAWNVFENKLAMTLDGIYLCIYEFKENGYLRRITKDDQRFLSYKSLSSTTDCKLETCYPFQNDLKRSKIPPYLFINHSFVILFNFPFANQSFNIHMTSLPEIWKIPSPEEALLVNEKNFGSLFDDHPKEPSSEDKELQIVEDMMIGNLYDDPDYFFNFQEKDTANNGDKLNTSQEIINYETTKNKHAFDLNVHKVNWEVKCEEFFDRHPTVFYERCEREDETELVKFEENRFLVRLEGLNVFFDLQSKFNFLPRKEWNLSSTGPVGRSELLHIETPFKVKEFLRPSYFAQEEEKKVEKEPPKTDKKKKKKIRDPRNNHFQNPESVESFLNPFHVHIKEYLRKKWDVEKNKDKGLNKEEWKEDSSWEESPERKKEKKQVYRKAERKHTLRNLLTSKRGIYEVIPASLKYETRRIEWLLRTINKYKKVKKNKFRKTHESVYD